ncbi:universal stress protein [Ferruginibacter sp.]
MTNILIPTDFSIASVKMAEEAVRALQCKKANIILFHAFMLPDPVDMLMGSRRKPYYDLVNAGFHRACKLVKEQNSEVIHAIQFRCMEGSTNALFRNFAEANDIDIIFCPEQYDYRQVHALSLDPRPFFKRSGIALVQRSGPRKKDLQHKEMPAPVIPVQLVPTN